ncbi:hypothetical protein [Halobacterium salinarum]|uniref:hypothetical protein n=1 Tax=Halobacterium salinarum TaxID=2242 RepID=UPI0025564466|nr:hypothetical protein [Halobacterium salinarum]MDL0127085.1 hypothetical protein [Halobacterium salinarum]
MGYDYTCDANLVEDCRRHDDVPAIAGQFREAAWLTDDFGGLAQDLGYDLHDTITICPECALAILR